MPDGYMIPPWLSNLPSPVDSYSRGLQIGASVGQDQARQQLAQEQMLREEQKAAVEQEIDKAKFQLQSDAQARKYAAQRAYDSAVQSGADPAQALLRYGPEMGITGPALAQFSKSLQQFPLNVQEKGGQQFVQTGPQSWQHVPQPAAMQPRLFHNADGTVTKVNPDGTAETIDTGSGGREPSITELTRAKESTFDPALQKEIDDIIKDRIKRTKAKGAFKFDRSLGKIVPIESKQETDEGD